VSRRLRTPPLFPCPLGRLAHSPFPLLLFLRLPFRYWIATLSASPVLSNSAFMTSKIKDLADKIEQAEGQLSHMRGGGGGSYLGPTADRGKKEETQLRKIVKDSSQLCREHLQGLMSQVSKDVLFNPGCSCAAPQLLGVSTPSAMDTSG
jgi:hypothetical protein